ncbi:MAG: radical SAM family heme chaperone HemW [Clostridiales bacterium]|nr:radical SAM family heme chaperone HemW [Clostridiales bacterium]
MTTDVGKKYGVYIHIPFCKAKCKYCAFVSTPDFSLQKSYVSALLGEINRCQLKGSDVDSIYIGGGTPSCLYSGGIAEILTAVKNNFNVLSDAEITVECNPESVDDAFADECKESGVNRISMGLQSQCTVVLLASGRIHTLEQYKTAIDILSRRFDNISSDIILGLPLQDISDIEQSLNLMTELKHVSVYALSVEQGTPLYTEGYSVDDDMIADFYDCACKKLIGMGFYRYEVSNFAKIGYESRHNNKYWNCMPYIGFGVAAHGYDGKRTRYKHGDDISEYICSPVAESYLLTDRDMYNEYVMLRLRTERGIAIDEFKKRFGYDFCERNADILNKLQSEGLIVCADGAVKIAPDRLYVMNSIIEQLMLD